MKFPRSFSNWTSVIGAAISLISLSMIVFLFALSALFDQGSSYIGLVIYIVLPMFLVLGLLLIPIGMFRKRRKDRKLGHIPDKRWPSMDLNDPKHRNAFIIFAVGTCLFLFLSSIGSYEAFHYTESTEFCGTLCHEVMKPEYVAYQNSAHARVACVECHVGPGADWFIRSKLSGMYQVYAVATDRFPRPIPTPIENLRPARETCERCHWPEKFYARQLREERHYLTDEQNTEWDISLQMKTGPSFSALGLQEGIHWHINPDVRIEYISRDEKREYIQWVKYTNSRTGEVYTYENEADMLDEADLASHRPRVMDCMDCHNRPSHHYQMPEFFVDNALTAGTIPGDLPFVKKLAMELMYEQYSSTDSALAHIEREMTRYYQTEYPDLFSAGNDVVNAGIKGLQAEFEKNIFPEMKVRWDVYPNHISHVQSNGCFRCHDDNHRSTEGRIISKDCNLCHSIVAQGQPGNMEHANIDKSLEFRHPVDIGDVWKEYLCIDCHFMLY